MGSSRQYERFDRGAWGDLSSWNTEFISMKAHEGLSCLRTSAARPGGPVLACALAAIVLSPALAVAKDAVRNLGGGLEQLAAPATRAQTLSAQRPVQKATAAGEENEAA